jgi:hypothetical protein
MTWTIAWTIAWFVALAITGFFINGFWGAFYIPAIVFITPIIVEQFR